MKKKEFEQILEECLDRLESGATIEELLEEYPQLAPRLEPLLRAAHSAWSLPEPDHQRSRREGRNRLLAEVDQMKNAGAFINNGTKPTFSRYSRQWFKNISSLLFGKENLKMKLLPRLALYGLMTVLIAGFFTVNASASSLPGDLLYDLKLGWEEFRLILTFDDDSRLKLEGVFEELRLTEIEALLGEGRVEDVEFYGVIETKSEGSWMISGVRVLVDAQTELKGTLEIGDLVKVEALTQEDGSLLALEIYPDRYEDNEVGDSDDDLDSDSDDDLDDDSDDDLDDDSEDEMDDDSEDEMDDDSEDEMDSDSDDDMSGSSDDDDSEYDDDDSESDDSGDEEEDGEESEDEEEEEEEEDSEDES
jgi:hypothetical protein